MIFDSGNITVNDSQLNIISWNVVDDTGGIYAIFINGLEVKIGQWYKNSSINYTIVSLEVGFYNFTIRVLDNDELSAINTIWVTANTKIETIIESQISSQVTSKIITNESGKTISSETVTSNGLSFFIILVNISVFTFLRKNRRKIS